MAKVCDALNNVMDANSEQTPCVKSNIGAAPRDALLAT